MTVTRAQFVGEALAWLDTPYQHQGRLKGVACDCIGLVIGVARGVGLDVPDTPNYGRRPDGNLRPALEAHLTRIAPEAAQGADVVLFAWNSVPLHVGILTDAEHLIHSYLPNRRVVQSRIDERMRRQIVGFYSVPGVE